MTSKVPGPRVISGEASESDDDDDAPFSLGRGLQTGMASSQVVISGEAPESDDEGDEDGTKGNNHTAREDVLPTLTVDIDAPTSPTAAAKSGKAQRTKKIVKSGTSYSSLLHLKLREKNSSFHNNLEQFTGHTYSSSAKELYNISAQLAKSQAAVQDVSHNMRLLTNDLFFLEDKIDIVSSCNILPSINIQVKVEENQTKPVAASR